MLHVKTRQFSAIAPAFNLPQLHSAPRPLLGVTPFEFCWDFWYQKTGVRWLSCGTVCVILRLANLWQTEKQMGGWTDTPRA